MPMAPWVQICTTGARRECAIAGLKANRPLAPDNLILEMNVSPTNLLPGNGLSLGTTEPEESAVPLNRCRKLIDRCGRGTYPFLKTGPGKVLRLRCNHWRVAWNGRVDVGQTVRNIG